jgi:methyltransferase (TIGR00027 family)
MSKPSLVTPDHTAVRTALWRALHVKVDAAPPVFVDVLGEKIVGEDNWQSRPDMDVEFCKPMRASIVARARFIEDLVEEQLAKGVFQYVLLGAGLDTFAFRRPELSAKMKIYEIDQPGPQKWKLKRIADAGLEVPQNLYFVPVDFETQQPWVGSLVESWLAVPTNQIFGGTLILRPSINNEGG